MKPSPIKKLQELFVAGNEGVAFGRNKEVVMASQPKDLTLGYVRDIFKSLTDRIKQNLLDSEANASRNLFSETRFEVELEGDEVVAKIILPDYYDFVDKGVQGFFSTKDEAAEDSPYKFRSPFPGYKMQNAIKKWITFKGIYVDYASRGEMRSRKKLADVAKVRRDLSWALAAKIKQDGTPATKFFSSVINKDTIADIERDLSRQLGKYVRVTLIGELTGKQ